MKFEVLVGDVVEVLPTLEANSFDAALCDPPYGLKFMGVGWDSFAKPKGSRGHDRTVSFDRVGGNHNPINGQDRARTLRAENHRSQDFHQAWAAELLRVLKPGAMLLAFGGTRTFHRLTCALEDAGFEIRDTLCWLYGSGFPKSLDISKAIDKAAGAEREVVGPNRFAAINGKANLNCYGTASRPPESAPASDQSRQWQGYGTALKPAWEPCIVAMKPLDGTFAANAQKWGVAGINVDGGRINPGEQVPGGGGLLGGATTRHEGWQRPSHMEGSESRPHNLGRWPANVILSHTPDCREVGTRRIKSQSKGRAGGNVEHAAFDGGMKNRGNDFGYASPDGTETIPAYDCEPECPVRLLDEQSGELSPALSRPPGIGSKGVFPGYGGMTGTVYPDSGGASRFFYTSKVSTAEREGSDHPTMKPIDLTRYLAKLILPPQRETPRRILVPFAGVGSEMIGAILAGWDEVVGIEKDEAYAAKARERIVGTAPLFLEVASK